ncbi:hypothetical protein [Porphyrobacter sp. YT40]|uniref:hypothetical protein n=1 Tax=Porphyrobacter sp. YT40 TaxID=2547601 RepID=UPI001143EDA7|nr:hypothetical protein [Porphyrobacter sp. YT40]QDH35299.1 hypothetical protein E2E27_13815 [Porphyrobacter sp. YT40]
MKPAIALAAAALFAIAVPLAAQNIENTQSYEWLMRQPVPVTTGDITDRPYRVIGHITKGVHKATIFHADPSHDKVMRELWEKARKMKADAVIHAQFGEARNRGFVKGGRDARGTAIRFLQGEELLAWQAQQAPAPR